MYPCDDDCEGYASSPCFLHEFKETISPEGPVARAKVERWRKNERERLIALRLSLPAEERETFSRRIAEYLDTLLDNIEGRVVSVYWPFRGEPDLRDWSETVVKRGGRCALPVVARKHAPLVFRPWRMGDPLTRGVWNIPTPANAIEIVPDVVIAPLVGFDPAAYRLGYGGGFFDRTLAAMTNAPRVIGVGFACARLATIRPQPHDIAMDAIVTEQGARSA